MEIFTETIRPELEPERDGIYLCSSKKRNCVGLEKENETATFRKRKQPKNRRIGYIQETICTRFRVFGYTYPLICTQNNTAERCRFKRRWQMWMVFGENACILRNTNLFMPTKTKNRKQCFYRLSAKSSWVKPIRHA